MKYIIFATILMSLWFAAHSWKGEQDSLRSLDCPSVNTHLGLYVDNLEVASGVASWEECGKTFAENFEAIL